MAGIAGGALGTRRGDGRRRDRPRSLRIGPAKLAVSLAAPGSKAYLEKEEPLRGRTAGASIVDPSTGAPRRTAGPNPARVSGPGAGSAHGLAVQPQIEAFDLDLGIDPEANHDIHNFVEDKAHHTRPDQGGEHADALDKHLMRIAFHQAGRAA